MVNRKKELEKLIDGMHVIARSLNIRNGKVTAEELTPSQWLVVNLVVAGENIGVKDISQKLHISSSAVTQMIDVLVKKNWLQRKENTIDRRQSCVTLSPAGRQKITKYKSLHLNKLLFMFSALTDGEFGHYLKLNEKIINNLKR